MLKIAVINMVIGIRNSIKVGLIFTIPKTARKSKKVCPSVKSETRISIRFHALASYGTVNASKNKTWS